MKRVSVFGSTGFVGRKAVQVLFNNFHDFCVGALVAGKNIHLLALQARLLKAEIAVVSDESLYQDLKELLRGTPTKVLAGKEGVAEAAALSVDTAVVAIMGIAALDVVMKLVSSGVCSIALANKESMVCGGPLLMNAAKEHGVSIIPVDSEHNAVFQLLSCKNCPEKVTLTASGGPFLHWSKAQMGSVAPSDALCHPVWKMGRKISIDSATMVNKSLEVIEAHHLFCLSPDKIDIIVHPESVVHAFVEYKDGATIALMSVPDMGFPIMHALYWPEGVSIWRPKLDLVTQGKLIFLKPDMQRFPALKLGFEILKSPQCHMAAVVFNAANEVSVDAFLNSEIPFLDIVNAIYSVMDRVPLGAISSLAAILECDLYTRNIAKEVVHELANKYSSESVI